MISTIINIVQFSSVESFLGRKNFFVDLIVSGSHYAISIFLDGAVAVSIGLACDRYVVIFKSLDCCLTLNPEN